MRFFPGALRSRPAVVAHPETASSSDDSSEKAAAATRARAAALPPRACARAVFACLPLLLFLLSAAALLWEAQPHPELALLLQEPQAPPAPAPAAAPALQLRADAPRSSFVPAARALLGEEEALPCGSAAGAARPLACEAWCAPSPFAAHARALSPRRSCAAAAAATAGAGAWGSALAAGAQQLQQLLQAPPAPPPLTPPPPPLLVLYTGYNGLADSLVGAVSAFYLALLAGAEFRMRFSDSPADPSFLWAFDPGCIDALSAGWTLRALQAPGGSDGGAAAEVLLEGGSGEGGGAALPARHYSFDAFHVPEAFLAAVQGGNVSALWGGARALSLHSHLGLVHHLLDNPLYRARLRGLGLTAHNAFSAAYHFLLRPRHLGLQRYAPELRALLRQQAPGGAAAAAGGLTIAIHVRSGVHHDGAFLAAGEEGDPLQRFAPFFSCAAEVEAQLAAAAAARSGSGGGALAVQWYLISDSLRLRQAAARAWPGKVLTRTSDLTLAHSRSSVLPGAAVNSTCTSFLDAAMEHWLFGLADAHVISQWSGFGRTGSLVHAASPPRRPVFQVYPLSPAPVSCALDKMTPMWDLATHLPGI